MRNLKLAVENKGGGRHEIYGRPQTGDIRQLQKLGMVNYRRGKWEAYEYRMGVPKGQFVEVGACKTAAEAAFLAVLMTLQRNGLAPDGRSTLGLFKQLQRILPEKKGPPEPTLDPTPFACFCKISPGAVPGSFVMSMDRPMLDSLCRLSSVAMSAGAGAHDQGVVNLYHQAQRAAFRADQEGPGPARDLAEALVRMEEMLRETLTEKDNLPEGMTQEQVEAVIDHYENASDEELVREDEEGIRAQGYETSADFAAPGARDRTVKLIHCSYCHHPLGDEPCPCPDATENRRRSL